MVCCIPQDLKPSNLLLDARGCLKLADFGLAVQLDTPEPYLFHQVVTLQCRAPELLLGARYHGRGVDLWAVGCILADMLCGAALFDKESEIQQLMAIVKALGSPSVATWPVRCASCTYSTRAPSFSSNTSTRRLHAAP